MSGGGMGNTSLMGYGGQGGGMGRFGGFNDPYNQPKGRFNPQGGFGGSPYGGFGGSPFGGRFGGSPFGGIQKPFYPGGGDSIGDAGFRSQRAPSPWEMSSPPGGSGFAEANQPAVNPAPPPGRGAATPGGYRGPVGDFGPGGNVIDNLTPRTPGTSFRGPARVPDEVAVSPPPPPPPTPEIKGGMQPPPTKPFIPNTGVMGQPGQFAAPNPGDNPAFQLPQVPPAQSGQQAFDNSMSQYNSPEYAAFYNSLAPSTRAFMHAPGNAQMGQYLAGQARDSYNSFGRDPWGR